MKHDEKERKKQGNMMKNREATMKTDETEKTKQWTMMKKREKQCKMAKRSNILSCDYFNFRIFYLVGARPCVFDILSCPD